MALVPSTSLFALNCVRPIAPTKRILYCIYLPKRNYSYKKAQFIYMKEDRTFLLQLTMSRTNWVSRAITIIIICNENITYFSCVRYFILFYHHIFCLFRAVWYSWLGYGNRAIHTYPTPCPITTQQSSWYCTLATHTHAIHTGI